MFSQAKLIFLTGATALVLISAGQKLGDATRAATPEVKMSAAGVVVLQDNGDLVAEGDRAHVVASENHYQRLGGLIVALPPERQPRALVVYEVAGKSTRTFRERFAIQGDGIASATAVMAVKAAGPHMVLVDLHINPSTGCFVALDCATGRHREILGVGAAASADGQRLAWLTGPPHAFPRDEYVDVFIDGVRRRHFAGMTFGELAWRDAHTVGVNLEDLKGRKRVVAIRAQ